MHIVEIVQLLCYAGKLQRCLLRCPNSYSSITEVFWKISTIKATLLVGYREKNLRRQSTYNVTETLLLFTLFVCRCFSRSTRSIFLFPHFPVPRFQWCVFQWSVFYSPSVFQCFVFPFLRFRRSLGTVYHVAGKMRVVHRFETLHRVQCNFFIRNWFCTGNNKELSYFRSLFQIDDFR